MAYQALYRKYRPQTFNDVLGQDSITRILKNQIKYNRVGHAYLLSGIRGTGKTSLAKIFARAINCENPDDGNPCYHCDSCKKIESPGVMDIIEIDGASNRGVDEIREIREKVKYPPVIGRYKVYIIDEVHMLTKEAFNALLKTLEEPPPHVVFILATTEPQKCPATILSRCQRYEVKPIANALIVSQLRQISDDLHLIIADQSLEFIALKGENSMRDALSLMDQIIDLKDQYEEIAYCEILSFLGMASQEMIRLIIEGMLEKNASEVIYHLRELQDSGKESQFILDQIIDYLRNVLLVKSLSGNNQGLIKASQNDLEAYEEVAKKASLNVFYEMIDHFINEKNKLKYSNLQNIILEMACLKLAYQDEAKTSVYVNNGLKEIQETKVTQSEPKIIKPNQKTAKLKEAIEDQASNEAGNHVDNEAREKVDNHAGIEVENKVENEAGNRTDRKAENEVAKKIDKKSENKVVEKDDKKETPAITNHSDEHLYQKLCDTIGSAQCIFLKKGLTTFTEEALFIDYREEDKDGYDFISRPEHVANFEKILKDYGKNVKVAVRLQKEDFNELDLVEKTKRIINDDKIKIVKD